MKRTQPNTTETLHSTSFSSSSSSTLATRPLSPSASEEGREEEETLSTFSLSFQIDRSLSQDMAATTATSLDRTKNYVDETPRTQGKEQRLLDPSNFTYRSIQLGDRDRIQQLHEEWFPVT